MDAQPDGYPAQRNAPGNLLNLAVEMN